MGNPLPADILSIYMESNGLQKLLTYFLDNLPSSVNGNVQSFVALCFSFERRSLGVGFAIPRLNYLSVVSITSVSWKTTE